MGVPTDRKQLLPNCAHFMRTAASDMCIIVGALFPFCLTAAAYLNQVNFCFANSPLLRGIPWNLHLPPIQLNPQITSDWLWRRPSASFSSILLDFRIFRQGVRVSCWQAQCMRFMHFLSHIRHAILHRCCLCCIQGMHNLSGFRISDSRSFVCWLIVHRNCLTPLWYFLEG